LCGRKSEILRPLPAYVIDQSQGRDECWGPGGFQIFAGKNLRSSHQKLRRILDRPSKVTKNLRPLFFFNFANYFPFDELFSIRRTFLIWQTAFNFANLEIFFQFGELLSIWLRQFVCRMTQNSDSFILIQYKIMHKSRNCGKLRSHIIFYISSSILMVDLSNSADLGVILNIFRIL
jgi:hypothetical protein